MCLGFVSLTIAVPVVGVDIHVHAVDLGGSVDEVEAEMTRLAALIGGWSA